MVEFIATNRFQERQSLLIQFEQAKKAGLEFLVTTEKDAVRIPEGFDFPIPLYYLRLEIKILSGVAYFEEAVSRICFPTRDPISVE